MELQTAEALPAQDDHLTRYHRVLGEELRRLRERRDWTRRDLKERLHNDVSLQTIATYELGTRQCTVSRLVEICMALGEAPHELLSRVHRKVFTGDAEVTGIRVDLQAVLDDGAPALEPLRRWARLRLPGAAVALDRPALGSLAQLCGLPVEDLAAHLHRIAHAA
jgi:transcriptional regulator with XRE-family HTH domain